MNPFTPPVNVTHNVADVPEELREKAFKRTAEMLRKLDEIRRSLELPVEHLPIVIETYGKVVLALIAEDQREDLSKHTQRLPITMRSENRDYLPMKIKAGDVAQVIVRPQYIAFRPEDFAIHGDRSRWVVHDIIIGGRSQFMNKRGPAAGFEFGPGGILEKMRLDVCQTAMELAMVIEYVGPDPDGEVFEATIVGTAVTY